MERNSSTGDTLTSLTSIETFLEEIKEMNHAILREEEDAATEFPSILPEELEWDNRAEDVAPSLDAIKRCLINMLTALDRDTPKRRMGLHLTTSQNRSLTPSRNRLGSGSLSRN